MSFHLEYPLISGRLLVNGNDFYLGNSSSQKVQIARVDQIPTVTQYVHPSSIQCNAASEISNLKTSVSSGKTQVANAITGKGVSASGNDSFATLANKINQIRSQTAVADSFINAAHVDDDWSYPYITYDEYSASIGRFYYSDGSSDQITLTVTPNDYGSGPAFWLERRGNYMNGTSVSIGSNIKKPEFVISMSYGSFPKTTTVGDCTLIMTGVTVKSRNVQGDFVYEEISVPLKCENGSSSREYFDLTVNEISLKFHWYFERSMRASVTIRYP